MLQLVSTKHVQKLADGTYEFALLKAQCIESVQWIVGRVHEDVEIIALPNRIRVLSSLAPSTA